MRRVELRLAPRAGSRLADYVVDCAWSSDGKTLAVALGDGSIDLVEATQGGTPRHVGKHALGALALDWFGGTTVLCSSGQDGAVKFWDTSSAGVDADSPANPATQASRQWTTHVSSRPAHREVATAAGRVVTVWSSEGKQVRELGEQTSTVLAMSWSADGKLFASASNGTMMLYRFGDGAPQVTRFQWPGASLAAAFSPNGRYIAAGLQDGAVRFRRLAAQESAEMTGYGTKVMLIGWTCNSRFLATASGDELVVWDFSGKGPQGREPLKLRGHTDRIVALAAHPDKALVASAGRDWRVALWEPGTNQLPFDVQLTRSEASVMRWSRDGKLLAVGQTTGDLEIYELISG